MTERPTQPHISGLPLFTTVRPLCYLVHPPLSTHFPDGLPWDRNAPLIHLIISVSFRRREEGRQCSKENVDKLTLFEQDAFIGSR